MRGLAVVVGGAMLALLLVAPPGLAQSRYEVANGCFSVRAPSGLLVKSGDGYRASPGEPERFRMQATALGKYLLYGSERDFLSVDEDGRIVRKGHPSERSVWELHVVNGAFILYSAEARGVLAAGPAGELVLGDPAIAGEDAQFSLQQASSCADFPEAEVNAVGEPFTGEPHYGEVRGFVDPHVHLMTFEMFGGEALYGRTWDPFGVAHALGDCAEIHGPNGTSDPVGNTRGSPGHETKGWPTFKDWPAPDEQTHNQTYYKWVERAWRGGLRLMVNLSTDNEVLCQVYPRKHNDCNEMVSARLQRQRVLELQDYIDAQSGGPGQGLAAGRARPVRGARGHQPTAS